MIGNRIYGCDDCLAVCPWNKFAQRTGELAFHPRTELAAPLLTELATLDEPGFRQLFALSPIKRIGRARFLRNVLIALGNSGSAASAPAAEQRLDDDQPLVRGMAGWALARLDPARLARLAATKAANETDAAVQAEWRQAAGSGLSLP